MLSNEEEREDGRGGRERRGKLQRREGKGRRRKKWEGGKGEGDKEEG